MYETQFLVKLGIDEAGRGCVIGPLVVAGVWVTSEKETALSHLGVSLDSKQFSKPSREVLYEKIIEIVSDTKVHFLDPYQLDQSNINHLEVSKFKALIDQQTVHQVLIDAPVPPRGINGFVKGIRFLIKHSSRVDIIAKNKADQLFPIVGAASIIAKVCRDWEIEKLHQKYGDFGSGYPSDPKTKIFLKEWAQTHRQWPDCVRQKWQTIQKLDNVALELFS